MLLTALLTMLAAAVAVPVVSGWLGRNVGYPLSLVFLGSAALLLTHAPEVLAGGVVVEQHPWVPAYDVAFTLRMDGLSLLFVILVLGVGALIMAYAPRYVGPGSHPLFYTVLTLFAGGMLGLVLSGDFILLMVFWEVTTVCSFLLIAGRGTSGARPAIRSLVVTAGGGLALLGAVVILAQAVGTTDVATVVAEADGALTPTQKLVVATLVILAAFTKSAQLPFHFWLPGAMVAITPVSAYLHAATLVKAGIYLLLRMSPLFADDRAWHLVLMSVGLATAVFGAFVALRQHDLKALLAYSTVSQLGLIVALVGVGTTASLGAAALLTAAHALFKATLFMLVGIIDREAGSRDLRRLSGLWRAMPVTAALTALAAMSMAGVPPLVGFVAKEELFNAFIGTSGAEWTGSSTWAGPVAGVLAVAAASLTFAYAARIIVGAFAGPLLQTRLYEPRATFLAPAAISALLGLVLGLVPWALNPFVNRTVIDAGFPVADSDLALWHGFTPALGMSVAAIVLGTTVHLGRSRIEPFLGPERDARATVWFDRAWDGLLRFGASVGKPTTTTAMAPHLVGVAAGVSAVVAVGTWGLAAPPLLPETARAEDWIVLAALLPTVTALALVRSTIGALVLVGVIGFTLSVWLLLLGAPDVAFTLLLVEILTVVVAVPVLRRVPDALPRGPSRTRTATTAVVAVVVGLAVGSATWLLAGRRGPSPAAEYLLAEAEPATGGSNVVNTILVNFRGLDTLGEISVLLAAAVGLLALLGAGGRRGLGAAAFFRPQERAVLRVGTTFVVPVLLVTAAVVFWRGHDLPGGGFIAGLVVGAALTIARQASFRLPVPGPVPLLVVGLALAVGPGLLGLVAGTAFLEPVPLPVPLIGPISSSLVFDVGVVLIVVGLVSAALDRLEAPVLGALVGDPPGRPEPSAPADEGTPAVADEGTPAVAGEGAPAPPSGRGGP